MMLRQLLAALMLIAGLSAIGYAAHRDKMLKPLLQGAALAIAFVAWMACIHWLLKP